MKTPHEFKILRVRECAMPDRCIETPEQAVAYWRANIPQSAWYDECKEALVVLVLNTRRRIIGHNLVSLGDLNSTTVHPREVFRPAICSAGAAIILAHNHPSGDPAPSAADIQMTRQIHKAGKLLRIDLLDHVIVLCQSLDKMIYAESRIMPSW